MSQNFKTYMFFFLLDYNKPFKFGVLEPEIILMHFIFALWNIKLYFWLTNETIVIDFWFGAVCFREFVQVTKFVKYMECKYLGFTIAVVYLIYKMTICMYHVDVNLACSLMFFSICLKTRSSADAEKPCATQYHPEGGKVSETGWLLYPMRRDRVNVSAADSLTALPLLSVFIRPKISKSTQVTGSPSH